MLLLLQGPRCKLLIALQPFQWKSIDRSGHLLRVCWCYHCSHLSSHEEMLAVSLVLIKISQRLLVRIASFVIYWMKFPHPPGFVTDVSAVSTLRQRLKHKTWRCVIWAVYICDSRVHWMLLFFSYRCSLTVVLPRFASAGRRYSWDSSFCSFSPVWIFIGTMAGPDMASVISPLWRY